MLVHKLEAQTASRLAVIDANAPVQTAALSLSRPGIGLVIVCGAQGSAEGVLSKSDLIRHLTNPAAPAPPVSALMSTSIISCRLHDDLHAVWRTMAARKLQNIPVVDAGARPLGILDIRDAMQALFEQEEMLERVLSDYVAGVGYR